MVGSRAYSSPSSPWLSVNSIPTIIRAHRMIVQKGNTSFHTNTLIPMITDTMKMLVENPFRVTDDASAKQKIATITTRYSIIGFMLPRFVSTKYDCGHAHKHVG